MTPPPDTVDPARIGTAELLEALFDAGSFVSWDEPIERAPDLSETYRSELVAAEEKSGHDESVRTGEGLIEGHRVALVMGEFTFLAGSVGQDAADRLVAAIERATAERLPLIGSPVSGGTRMQEGTPAFVRMIRIAAAVQAHRSAGLPYLVYLRHPTTGGVMATWGSLGHATFASPGALTGFLGPRVYEAIHGEPFPDGVQTAENLAHRGVIDRALPLELVRPTFTAALRCLAPSTPEAEPPAEATSAPTETPDAWDSILLTRREDRPGIREVLADAATELVELSGTTAGERDPAVLLALARIGGVGCVVAGQDRAAQSSEHALGPGGLRTVQRGARLAEELRVPLVTVVDTPGAELSAEAENGALAGEIARTLALLSALATPTISVLLGQGNGGGALALLPADHVIAARHAWLTPLPPEGASAIVHRTVDRAPEMARAQRIRAVDLVGAGLVEELIMDETPGDLVRGIAGAMTHALARAVDVSSISVGPEV